MFLARLLTFLGEVTPETDGGEDLDGLWNTILGIKDDLMPFVYGALALFLVVKGALLGVQIVKAADEPQVRQEKIGSLKWLVIGIAVAFGVAFAADTVINYFGKISGQETAPTDTGTAMLLSNLLK